MNTREGKVYFSTLDALRDDNGCLQGILFTITLRGWTIEGVNAMAKVNLDLDAVANWDVSLNTDAILCIGLASRALTWDELDEFIDHINSALPDGHIQPPDSVKEARYRNHLRFATGLNPGCGPNSVVSKRRPEKAQG